MSRTVVFDLDKVLLSGDASTLFLSGALRRRPHRVLALLPAAPLLLVAAAVPQLRAPGARLTTRLAADHSVAGIAAAYRTALSTRPEAAVAEALARVRAHRADGDVVVVATGCEETMARGFLAALGLGDLDVVGSRAGVPARRAMGEGKVRMLAERGYPPPWAAVYSDSASDLPLFAGAARPVLVNAGERAARRVARVLGREPETLSWR